MISRPKINYTRFMARFKGMESRAYANLVRVVTRLTIKLQGKVKAEKLSGQVLKNRTGTLRRSINQKVIERPNQVLGRVGTNVVYGRAHELGFVGSVQVKEHLRTIKEAWGREIEPREVRVRAHTAKRTIPQRSFLRSSLREMAPEIRADLAKAIGADLK